jgi:GNAT superfamily N-acetyltransferase
LITYHTSPPLDNESLNVLLAAAWYDHTERDFRPVLQHSLTYITARDGERLVGFVNLAWDGGIHAFLLDTTVHPAYQRRGIGQALVQHAIEAAQTAGMRWLHVDYLPHLESFYRHCGFRPTSAGLIAL